MASPPSRPAPPPASPATASTPLPPLTAPVAAANHPTPAPLSPAARGSPSTRARERHGPILSLPSSPESVSSARPVVSGLLSDSESGSSSQRDGDSGRGPVGHAV